MSSHKDRYLTFADLGAAERHGIDYRIVCVARDNRVVIVAPHGGSIEPGTSELARAIAGQAWSLYCFEGLDPTRPHRDLHITSPRFDEPQCRALVAAADVVVAVHGRSDRGDQETVLLGGRDGQLIRDSEKALYDAGFVAQHVPGTLDGSSVDNICNRSKTGAGLQLELPRSLRDRLRADTSLIDRFAGAIRTIIR